MLKKFILTSLAVLATASTALADYPEKPITMIVPWGAGGGTDAIARVLAKGMEDQLGVSIAVVNRSGGAGVVGHNAIVNATADGYTVGFGTAELTTYYWTGNAGFTAANFTPISLINFDPGAFHVSADSEWETITDALASIEAEPLGTYKMSGTAVGAAYHLAFAGFLEQQGIDPLKVTMVPSQGAASGFQELAAGGIEIIPSSLPEGKTMMQAGRSKPLTVFSNDRIGAFPEVPTSEEVTGLPYEAGTWRGLIGPSGMNPFDVEKLEAAAKAVYESDAFQSFMTDQGFGTRFLAGAEFREFMTDAQESNGTVLNAIGLGQRSE